MTINTAAGDDSIGTATASVTISQTGTNKITIDGSAGNDVLYGTVSSALTSATTIANVEKVYLNTSTTASKAIDAANWSGINELWALNSTGQLQFSNLASTKIGIENSTAGGSFTFKAGVASADLTLKNVAGDVTATGAAADFKALTVNVASKSEIGTFTTAAQTVTATGAAELKIGELTNTVKTFDASGVTKAVSLGATTTFDSNAASTIKFGAGADTLKIAFSDAFQDTITLGAGKDTVIVAADAANVTVTAGKITSFAEFTDFTKGDDTLALSSLAVATTSTLGQASIEAAITKVLTTAADATNAAAAGGVVFEFNGSTYLYKDAGTVGTLDTGDGLIKLTGVTGLTVGGAGSDLLNA